MNSILGILALFVFIGCSSAPKMVSEERARKPDSSETVGVFPLMTHPLEPYDGSKRADAGARLITQAGSPVLSVLPGGQVIRGPYAFVAGVYAVEVKYPDGSIVRYGGLTKDSNVKVGDVLEQGALIGHVGQQRNTGFTALYFEMYSGTAQGPLTQSAEPNRRRSDLVNPTPFLLSWEQKLGSQ